MPTETRRRPSENVRLPRELLKVIDTWADAQSDLPKRPEAIRRLVEKGLKGE